jgi:dolichol kinase
MPNFGLLLPLGHKLWKLVIKPELLYIFSSKRNKLRGLSPRANFTDRATKLVSTFSDRGVSRSQRCGSPIYTYIYIYIFIYLFIQLQA